MAFFSVTSSELRNRAGRITELNGQFKSKTTVLGEQESATNSELASMVVAV